MPAVVYTEKRSKRCDYLLHKAGAPRPDDFWYTEGAMHHHDFLGRFSNPHMPHSQSISDTSFIIISSLNSLAHITNCRLDVSFPRTIEQLQGGKTPTRRHFLATWLTYKREKLSDRSLRFLMRVDVRNTPMGNDPCWGSHDPLLLHDDDGLDV